MGSQCRKPSRQLPPGLLLQVPEGGASSLHCSEQKLQPAVSRGLPQRWHVDAAGSMVLKGRRLRKITSTLLALNVCTTN